jgi:hypothetical protein
MGSVSSRWCPRRAFAGEASQLVLCARQFSLPGGLILDIFHVRQITKIDPDPQSLRYAFAEGRPLVAQGLHTYKPPVFRRSHGEDGRLPRRLEAAVLYLGGLKEDFEQE